MTGRSTPYRPLKRWVYAGLFGPEVMVCAAQAQVGPLRQAFWAVWDREAAQLHERTLLARRARVLVTPERLRVVDGGVRLDLALSGASAVEVTCPSGSHTAWTRKTALRGEGSLSLGGAVRPVGLTGVLDESAGRHEREVDWRWCAGVGRAADGRALAWNLVTGINDPPHGSERAVWIDGETAEPAPVVFAPDLSAVAFAGGEELRFGAEATRARRDRVGPLLSEYAQPFGTFAGTLPGGVELAEGYGVMERHHARW